MPHVDIKLSIKGENLSLVKEVIKRLWDEKFCSDYFDSIRVTKTQLTFKNEIGSETYLSQYYIINLVYVLKRLFPDIYIHERVIESFSESVFEKTTSADTNFFIETLPFGKRKIKLYFDLNGNLKLDVQRFLRKQKLMKLNNISVEPKKHSEEVIFKYIEKYQEAISLKRESAEIEEDMETASNTNNNVSAAKFHLKLKDLDEKYSKVIAECNEILLKG
jgi:hypothetical protein